MEEENENSIKNSPNYEQQLEEIEILQNILLEKVIILKEEPNFNIKIEIEGDNNEQEEKFKTFYLEVYLNNDYPEKSPKIKIYEANNNLSEQNKQILTTKLEEYCQENLGMPVIYQLYEIVKEFADEEEKISFKKEKQKKNSGQIPYELNSLQKTKQIKIKDSYPIDIYIIKNENILVVYKNGLIKIFDNHFENILFELLRSKTDLPIIFVKYFDFSSDDCSLYLFNLTNILVYKISFLPKKNIIEDSDYKMNGVIKIDFICQLNANDVIEFPQNKDYFFIINEADEDESGALLYKYSKKNLNCKSISKNEFKKPFRKLYYINQNKFILASYTLKTKGNNISGINKMCIVDSNTFEISKSYDIKISPLNNNIETYKNKYLILSYFTTIKKEENSEDDPYYSFEDNFYNEIFHNLEKKVWKYNFYDDAYFYENQKSYDDYENVYYAYDIKQHYIGIYSIKYEEFITKIEFDLMKRVYNIKDNLLCLFVRKGKSNKKTQIIYERLFHEYYNDIPLEEIAEADNYKTENYLAYALLNIGFNVLKGNVDYDNITCFKDIYKNGLVICSEKKGITLNNQLE